MRKVLRRPSTVLLLPAVVICASAEESAQGEHKASHHYHEHVIAGFVGVAFEGSRDEGLALGIESILRLGVGYGFRCGNWEFSPAT